MVYGKLHPACECHMLRFPVVVDMHYCITMSLIKLLMVDVTIMVVTPE